MKDPNKAKFLEAKKVIAHNLRALEKALLFWAPMGFPDENSILYNHILDLLGDVDVIKTVEDLTIIMEKAQNVELSIEAWLAKEGQNTLELTWPDLSALS